MNEFNPLEPTKAVITEIIPMTSIENQVKIALQDYRFIENFSYLPGQFMKLGVMGVGEAPISICTAQKEKSTLEFCIRNAGRVTNAIHSLKEGDTIWVRGPYGNGFPMEKFKGKDLLLVAGGLGVAPLRGVLQYVQMNRRLYGDVQFLYGIRSYDLMLYKDEIVDYHHNGESDNINLYLSYEDPEDETLLKMQQERGDRVLQGLVTKLFAILQMNTDNTYAILGGPPIMYKFVNMELEKFGFSPDQIYMTLERRMRCGVGQCGHCIVGSGKSIKYVCKDGPVFTLWDALNTQGMI